MCVLSHFSSVWLFATLWIVACQAQFIRFSRQEYWNGLPYPVPGDLPDPGIKPVSLTSPALSDRFFTTSITWEAHGFVIYDLYYVEVWSLNNHSVANFYHHKWMLNYVKKKFLQLLRSLHDFILQFVNMVYHIDWFADIEPSMHPWDKSHLILVCRLRKFCMLTFFKIFYFCIYDHQWYWSVVPFFIR